MPLATSPDAFPPVDIRATLSGGGEGVDQWERRPDGLVVNPTKGFFTAGRYMVQGSGGVSEVVALDEIGRGKIVLVRSPTRVIVLMRGLEPGSPLTERIAGPTVQTSESNAKGHGVVAVASLGIDDLLPPSAELKATGFVRKDGTLYRTSDTGGGRNNLSVFEVSDESVFDGFVTDMEEQKKLTPGNACVLDVSQVAAMARHGQAGHWLCVALGLSELERRSDGVSVDDAEVRTWLREQRSVLDVALCTPAIENEPGVGIAATAGELRGVRIVDRATGAKKWEQPLLCGVGGNEYGVVYRATGEGDLEVVMEAVTDMNTPADSALASVPFVSRRRDVLDEVQGTSSRESVLALLSGAECVAQVVGDTGRVRRTEGELDRVLVRKLSEGEKIPDTMRMVSLPELLQLAQAGLLHELTLVALGAWLNALRVAEEALAPKE